MDYQHVYDQIMTRAKTRSDLIGYTERHHVIPRALDGPDCPENIVTLTAREHFLAHLLLAKIHGGKMWHAAHMMSNMKRYSSRTYRKVREEHAKLVSQVMSGKTVNKNTKEKMKDSQRAFIEKLKAAGVPHPLAGVKKSKHHVRAWRESRQSGAGWIVSDEHKRKISAKMSGKGNPMWGETHTTESIQKISEANKQKIKCPHCSTIGGISIMRRWHFENCPKVIGPDMRKRYERKVCPHCGQEGGGSRMISNHFNNCRANNDRQSLKVQG